MEALYVVEPGSYIRKDGMSLKIMQGKDVLADIPAEGLERLTLVGRATLSGSVLDFLIRNRIETVFMTPSGRFRARLMLDERAHVSRRRAQYARLSDEKFVLETARTVVMGKLANQADFLRKRARDYGEPELRKIAARILGLKKMLGTCADTDAVRGFEGYGTRLYFGAFALLLRNPDFSFTGRNRRPPTDPVNAMLSFVYTMLTNEILSAVKTAGLDPYLGALHEVAHGRPSLACDLVEEWRTLADRLVIGLVNRKLIRPEDFVVREATREEGPRPVELKPGALRALIKAFERQMERPCPNPATGDNRLFRWSIHDQVRLFGRYLEEEACPYLPFRIPL